MNVSEELSEDTGMIELELPPTEDFPAVMELSTAPLEVQEIMLKNEKIVLRSESFVLINTIMNSKMTASLFCTNYQLIIFNSDSKRALYAIPCLAIRKAKAYPKFRSASKESDTIDIHCKDGRILSLKFNNTKEKERVAKMLKACIYPVSVLQFFAFKWQPVLRGDAINGHTIYDFDKENERIGLLSTDFLRVSDANKDFKLCSTYPERLVVRKSFTNEILAQISSFRSRGRIPVCVWLHKGSGASLWRCSQPCVGMKKHANTMDEKYLSSLRNTGQVKLVINDSRPRKNAVANRLRGGGYEFCGKVYTDCVIEFQNIENIHNIRHSLIGVQKLCRKSSPQSDTSWNTHIAQTQWLFHAHLILSAAARVASQLSSGQSVLVHCSDGWDRTAQTTSLAQLLLDPYYRTLEGFIVLIEKEWISYGHKFATRHGHGNKIGNYKDGQRAPIFQEFIDCVWQLMQHFPRSFEFNERFLITILDHVHSCLFGTFLFNCELERRKAGVREKTVSLWTYIYAQRPIYLSSQYDPASTVDICSNPVGGAERKSSRVSAPQLHESGDLRHSRGFNSASTSSLDLPPDGIQYGEDILVPCIEPHTLQLWSSFYFRWNPNLNLNASDAPPTPVHKVQSAPRNASLDRPGKRVGAAPILVVEDAMEVPIDSPLFSSPVKALAKPPASPAVPSRHDRGQLTCLNSV